MKSSQCLQYTLSDLIKGLDVTLQGDANCLIEGVSPIQQSQAGHISFLANPLYRKHLAISQASAVILSQADAAEWKGNAIICRNPYYVYAKIAGFFADQADLGQGIHPSVVVGEGCEIHASAIIAANCVIGNHVKIAAGVVIGSGTVVSDHVEIDQAAQLDARVTLYHRVKIGKRSRIASGAVIGSEGFGFANHQGAWHKVPQLGTVIIGDDVDIGANTTIDRGAVENTIIGNGVKLDNLIQIGHNVCIGENTIMAGCAGVAGSTSIGKNCMIGGRALINGHITICDNVIITGGTGVSKSIREPGMYSSGVVGAVPNKEFRESNARFHRLGNLMERVKKLETAVKDFIERNK
jgi:UDP-3-O-[3-hydroxymyristoyl] glucosamine N-acyltransferase